MNFTCRKLKSVQHSTRESRRYGQYKNQEGVAGQDTVGEESGKKVNARTVGTFNTDQPCTLPNLTH